MFSVDRGRGRGRRRERGGGRLRVEWGDWDRLVEVGEERE